MNKMLSLLVAILLSACGTSQSDSQQANPSTSAPAQNTTSPNQQPANNSNFVVSTARMAQDINQQFPYDIDLKTADGKIVKSSEAFSKNGKPTVLLFWLTTCMPCRYELEAIKGKYEFWKAQTDFNLYAVSTDFPKNYERFVERVKTENWAWPAYNDVNREFMHVMPGELNGLPQTFIFDKDGKIVYHSRKFRPGDEDVLFNKIKEVAGKS